LHQLIVIGASVFVSTAMSREVFDEIGAVLNRPTLAQLLSGGEWFYPGRAGDGLPRPGR
jgi:hypothetical protein